MNQFRTSVLLIGLHKDHISILTDYFETKSYRVLSTSDENAAVNLISQEIVHLIICNQDFCNGNSCEFFMKLRPSLIEKNLPFFFLVNEFNKDDMLIALEIGVSNFIFTPFNFDSISRKVDNEFAKRSTLNFSLNSDFDAYFNENTIPLLFVHKDKVTLMNQLFVDLVGEKSKHFYNKAIFEVFDLNNTENSSLRFKRFESSLTKFCNLKAIKVKTDSNLFFDLFMLRDDSKDYIIQATLSGDYLNNDNGILNSKSSYIDQSKLMHSNLTKRERQVLKLSASGLPIKIIAQELKLSARTIEKHRSNIMEKVGAKNMIEAIRNL